MKKKHDFKYSDDNKRYHTYNYFLRQKYHQKCFRIPLDAGFTCPNRDGERGIMGCSFCSIAGSGDTIIRGTLQAQIDDGFKVMRNKWPDGLGMAYFQAYTNTYDTLENLKELYDPFFEDDRIIAVIIATRADCLDKEKIEYFKEKAKLKDLYIEIGLQTIHPITNYYINRGHDNQIVTDTVKMLQEANIHTTLHIINGLPNETPQMMLDTAQYCADLKVDGIKIHMFQILKNTLEAYRYKKDPYPLLTQDEFVDITIKQLQLLPQETVIMRLTGDPVVSELVGPKWTTNKISVLNQIDKTMAKYNLQQGDMINEKQQ